MFLVAFDSVKLNYRWGFMFQLSINPEDCTSRKNMAMRNRNLTIDRGVGKNRNVIFRIVFCLGELYSNPSSNSKKMQSAIKKSSH